MPVPAAAERTQPVRLQFTRWLYNLKVMSDPGKRASDRMDRTLAALAHPARRVMLARLAQGRASASELGALVDVSQPAVSKHLKVLEQAGLITRGRDAQWRPCELRPDALADVEALVQQLQRTWEERLDRLDRYVREVRRESGTRQAPAADASEPASPDRPTTGQEQQRPGAPRRRGGPRT